MSPKDLDHHLPRAMDKGKHHRHGFSEDARLERQRRVSFKKYLQELEEQELAAEMDNSYADVDEANEPLNDAEKEQIISEFKEWSGGFTPNETTDGDIQTYVDDGIWSSRVGKAAILSFLRNYVPEE